MDTNENNAVDEFKDDFPLFIEAAFVAVKQFDEMSATRLFEAAAAINPKSQAPKIGLGHIALCKLELKEATRIFEEVLAVEPDNEFAQCFLGLSFILSKDKTKKGEKMLEDVLAKAKDPTIQNLAKVSIEWAADEQKQKKSSSLYSIAEEKKTPPKESPKEEKKDQPKKPFT